jgi:adenylate kinase family enzyme
MDLSRVHIVGSSCSGKTTFARKLAAVVSGRATTTIWLDPPFVKILARFFKRSIRRSLTREVL